MANVVITGAARGIGRELAKLYLAAGDQVIAGVRKAGSAPDGTEEIALDVADAASVTAFARAIGDRPVDILINNAGVNGAEVQSATEMDFDAFARTLAINTLGPLRVTQALLPALRRAKGAKIATISSRMASLSEGGGNALAYRTSKTAVNKVMQGVAIDLEGEGIAVTTLHPGWVRTDMGGSQAPLEPVESATALKQVIDGLTLAGTGQFLNYDGTVIPW